MIILLSIFEGIVDPPSTQIPTILLALDDVAVDVDQVPEQNGELPPIKLLRIVLLSDPAI